MRRRTDETRDLYSARWRLALDPALPAVPVMGRSWAGVEQPRRTLHVEEAAVVLVGDVDAFGEALEATSLGTIVIERDPIAEPQRVGEPEETPGPVDKEDQEGPTAGAEEPELPGGPGEEVTAD